MSSLKSIKTEVDDFIERIKRRELKCMICGYEFKIDDIDSDEPHGIISMGLSNLYIMCRNCKLKYPITFFISDRE